MTDTEIIKALECCSEHNTFCKGCSYKHKTVENCDSDLCKDAVALIKRQKAEIDILIRKKDTLRDEIAEQKAEIERLLQKMQQAYGIQVEVSEKLEKEIKSEAINEFAMMLKCGVPQETGVIRCADVDNLVKEMTEQKE